jgi:hypothetical protein
MLPDTQNRAILALILRDRGIPFEEQGASLIWSPPESTGNGSVFILAVPLAYAGEMPLSLTGPLPLRFAAALSFIEEFTAHDDGSSPDEGASIIVAFPGKEPGGMEQAAELERIRPLDEMENAILWYLDIPVEDETPGALVFASGRLPGLGYVRGLPALCDELGIPRSFEVPLFPGTALLARQAPTGTRPYTEQQLDEQFQRYRDSILVRGGKGEATLGAEVLGELIRRYGTGIGATREHNYLMFQLAGKKAEPRRVVFISELRLALLFLAGGTFFFCGLIFFPRFPFWQDVAELKSRSVPIKEQGAHIVAIVILWLCILGTAATAIFRLNLYPFWAPAMILSFAARSIRKPLAAWICISGAGLYAALLLFTAF